MRASRSVRWNRPRRVRNRPWATGPWTAAPAARAAAAKAAKSTWAVRSAVPGSVSGSVGPAIAQRLEAVAGRAVLGAVVEEQRGAGADGQAVAQELRDRERGFVEFDDGGAFRPLPRPPPARGGGDRLVLSLLPLPLREGVGGGGAAHSTKRPSATNRSIHASPRRTNCRIGSASRNSLASSSSGRSGSVSSRSCHAASGSRSACTARSRGDVSIRCSRSAARNAGATRRTARSASAISVPRPGPASTSSTGSGRPSCSQVDRRPQSQDLAEHLADLGRCREVAERIVRRVVGGVGARHEAVQALHQRGAQDQPEPAEQHRDAQQLAHRHAADQEAQEHVGLAEELADDARDGVAAPGTPRSASRSGRAATRVGTARASPRTAPRLPAAPRKAGSDGAAPGRPCGKDHRPGQPVRRRRVPTVRR